MPIAATFTQVRSLPHDLPSGIMYPASAAAGNHITNILHISLVAIAYPLSPP